MYLKLKIQNTVWENVFKYKYSILYFENTQIHLKLPSSEVTLLRPVYTKNNNYKDNYISVF